MRKSMAASIQKKAGRSYRTDRSGTDMEAKRRKAGGCLGEGCIGDHYFECIVRCCRKSPLFIILQTVIFNM